MRGMQRSVWKNLCSTEDSTKNAGLTGENAGKVAISGPWSGCEREAERERKFLCIGPIRDGYVSGGCRV
jgi:hypothetical protein